MRIMLLGANSQLGSDLLPALAGHQVLATVRQPLPADVPQVVLDLTDAAATCEAIRGFGPQVVINTTAFHRVDDIEKDALLALTMNGHVPHQLARMCREVDAALVHVSTDYVFDGAKRAPYVEQDALNPLSAYGATKAAGEMLVRTALPKHYLVRSCGLYGLAGSSGKGGNFVNTMLRLAQQGKPIRVVDDQVCTPTFTRDLAGQIVELIATGAYGTYHATAEGACTWHAFAAEIFLAAGLKPDFGPTTSQALGLAAVRPPYSVLENAGLRRLGIDRMRPWRVALGEYVGEKLARGGKDAS